MSTVQIELGGDDITSKVVIETAHFESQVNGVAGEAKFRVRDEDGTYTATLGSEVVLTIDGTVEWRGFLTMWTRTYVFPAYDVTEPGLARFFDATCSDVNLLLVRRIVFDQAAPENVTAPLLAAHTADIDALTDLFADWLDLTGDGIDTSSLVENVGDTTWTQAGRAWEGSDTWAQAVQSIASLPAAIYYIDPDKNFVYTDVDTPDASFGLSDVPNGDDLRGYREMEVLFDGTGLANDVLAWGAGYGSNQPVFTRIIDDDSVTQHGLWQQSSLNFGVYKQATIERIAESVIYGSPQSKRGAKDDRVAVQCVVYEPGLRVAQKVLFRSNVFDWLDVLPIRKMAIDFDGPETPKYSLTLSHEIDTPFHLIDNFSFLIPKFKFCLPPMVMGPNGTCILPPLPPGEDCTDLDIDDFEGRTTSGGIWGDASSGPTWVDELADGDFAYVAAGVGVLLTQPFVFEGENAPGGDQKLTFAVPYAGLSKFILKIQPLNIGDGEVTLFLTLGPLFISLVMRPDFMSVLDGGISSLGISQEDVDSDTIAPIPNIDTWETSGWWTLQVDYMPNQYARAQVWHDGDPQPGPQVSIVPVDGGDIGSIEVQIGRYLGYTATVGTFGVTDWNGYLGMGIEYSTALVGYADFGGSLFQGKAFGFCSASEFQAYAQVLEQFFRLVSVSGGTDSVAWVMELVDIPAGAESNPFDVPASDWWTATAIGTIASGGGIGNDYTSPGLGFGPYDIDVAGPTSFAWRITSTAGIPVSENYLELFVSGKMFYHGTPAADPDADQGLVFDDISSRACTRTVPLNGYACENQVSAGSDTITLQASFLPQSTTVWIDGLFYARSFYTEDPATNTITLDGAPSSGAIIRVCYWAVS